ncbi:mucin-17, partial [Biomphalaria glabrata]
DIMSSSDTTTHNEFHNGPLHDLITSESISKDESSIQDLARYLSCATSSEKDTMIMENKGSLPDPCYNQQTVFNSLQDVNQGPMCIPDSSYGTSTPESTSSLPSNQQYTQNTFGSNNILYATSTNTSLDQGHLQTLPSVTGNNVQYFHDVHNNQYQQEENNLQFHSSTVGAFQNLTQTDSTDFQSTSVLTNSFSPTNNTVHYSSNQGNLGFSMMDINPNLTSNQFKTPEKMHVDEPDGLFHQSDMNTNNNNDYFQFKPASTEANMQTYQSENCQQQSEASSFIPINTFTPTVESSANGYTSGLAVNSSTENLFPASSFDSNNFISSGGQNLQPSTHSFPNSNNSVAMHYSPPQPMNEANSPDFVMQSSPSPNQQFTEHQASNSQQPVQSTTDLLLAKQSMETAESLPNEQSTLSNYSVNPSSTVPISQSSLIATSLSSNSFINFSATDNITLQDFNGKACRELEGTQFTTPSTSCAGLQHFHNESDAFPHLDLQAVVNGNFDSSISRQSDSQPGIFAGYPFENNVQSVSYSESILTPTLNSIPSNSVEFLNTSTPGIDFDQHNQLSRANAVTFAQNLSHSSIPTSEMQGAFHLQSNELPSSQKESKLQPTEVYPQPMQVQETKPTDTSSVYSFQDHPQAKGGSIETAMDISSNISFEDIHRSIVKAGNSFIKDTIHPGSDYVQESQSFSTESNSFYDLSKLHSVPETSTPSTQVSFTSNSDYNSMLNNSSAILLTDLVTSVSNNQPHSFQEMPNFLHTPVVSGLESDANTMEQQMKVNDSQSCFISSVNNAGTSHTPIKTVQEDDRNSVVQSLFQNSLLISSEAVSSSSLQSQLNTALPSNVTLLGDVNSTLPITEQIEPKPNTYNLENSAHLSQKPQLTTIVMPTLGTSSCENENSPRTFSLEEVQKMLAQQTLSQNSFSMSQQPTSLPPTLVLQKPTSSNVQWLKLQPHPRLIIKGSTFSSAQRPIQPQQQLQQTREKLVLVQQSAQSQLTNPLEAQRTPAPPLQLVVTPKEQPQMHNKLHLLQPTDQQTRLSFHMKPTPTKTSQSLVYQVVSSPEQFRTSFQLSAQKQNQSAVYFTPLSCAAPPVKKDQDHERSERQCSDSIKKEYKHLHSLLTGDTSVQSSTVHPVLNLSNNLQSSLHLASGSSLGLSNTCPSSKPTPTSAPFSFLPLSTSLSLPTLSSACIFVPSVSAATSTASAPVFNFSNVFSLSSTSTELKDIKSEASNSNILLLPEAVPTTDGMKLESSQVNATVSSQVSLDRKRSHTPLSVDIHSPNSNSETPSPLSSPVPIEDGNTQATLIERSADLHIQSDTMQAVNDDDENASFFDINSFHKRPSTEEVLTSRRNEENVPIKILKGSLNADARSSVQPSLSPEQTFDIGSVVSTASSFSFALGDKEDNSEIFTFGSGKMGASTTESLKYKSGSKRGLSLNKSSVKTPRAPVPTQHVRPVTRKQFSLKAYYPSKIENMELKIVEQPESHHRARYQTEGSRGAIKDASQQGFPIVKLVGYNRATKLQVFIGDESGRVKPHGFYQACRVFGKNSTACTEQEIEGTTVIEIDLLPENHMTVKMDCIGILKLRNADVERRIGAKRARDKKKNNTKARLVMRAAVEKLDGSVHILQAVSNPVVCTQPVGQPEICRMSISESSTRGGDSLFIIGKNFKNKGTSVLFQKLDLNEEVIVWQAEAEIDQEFFQPTHLICKVPAYKDEMITKPEQVQIVVSCAGKISDAQGFTYKPVYQVAHSVKQEIAMETDGITLAKALPIVSPEALQLNQMVLESSSPNSIFQLPAGTVPSLQSSSPVYTLPTLSENTVPDTDRRQVQRSVLPTDVHISVHKHSDMFSAGPSSYSVSGSRGPSNSGPVNRDTSSSCSISKDTPSSVNVDSNSVEGQNVTTNQPNVQNSSLESTLSSKPIVVVLDTGNLPSESGCKIQQLLQQILEAQNKK